VPYYIGSPENLHKLNKWSKKIHLPVEARRAVRDFDEWANWKGREWENFILYTSVILVQTLLPKAYLSHWILFVQSMHYLLQDEISEDDIKQAERLLRLFATKLPQLYPEHHLTYNMHIVTKHLAEHCRRWGNLWSVNGYSFEDGNRILKNKIHANKGIASQVCRALSHIKSLGILRSHVSTPYSDKFQNDIEKNAVSSCIYIGNDKYFGRQKMNPTDEEIFLYNQKGIQYDNFVSVTKLIHEGCVYKTSKSRSMKTNCIALLKGGEIVLIHTIIISEELSQGYLIVQKVRTTPHLAAQGINPNNAFLKSVAAIHQESFIVSPTELRIVCARLTLEHGDYVVKVPNFYNTT
jgi:hypothetical protein